jgi:hypothetical protein
MSDARLTRADLLADAWNEGWNACAVYLYGMGRRSPETPNPYRPIRPEVPMPDVDTGRRHPATDACSDDCPTWLHSRADCLPECTPLTGSPFLDSLPVVRCDDVERLADYAESGEPFTTDHICGRNALRHVAQMEADREAAERDVEQMTWEEAVANDEPWTRPIPPGQDQP